VTSPARAGTSAVVAVLGAAGLLLVLVTWAASIGPDRVVSGGHVDRVGHEEPSSSPASAAPGQRGPGDRFHHRSQVPAWQSLLALALEAVTICVGLFLLGLLVRKIGQLWRQRSRRRRRTRPQDVEYEVLGSAAHVTEVMAGDAEEQRSVLSVEGEPRNAIVACWQRFEKQASRAGVERRDWQTTAEFVLGILDLVGADRGAVARLAELYREARFSDHPMSDDHRRAALEALDAIHGSLRSRAVSR
jgi:hypothetical protein